MTDEEGARINAYSAWLRLREQQKFEQAVQIERARRFWDEDGDYQIYVIKEEMEP